MRVYRGLGWNVFLGSEARAEGEKGERMSDMAYHDRRSTPELRRLSSPPSVLSRSGLIRVAIVSVVVAAGIAVRVAGEEKKKQRGGRLGGRG